MSATLDQLKTAVSEERTITTSAVMLLHQLTTMVEAAKNDPTEIQAILDDVRSQQADLAAAVAQNTPASGSGNSTEATA